jgi:uncharacterized protein YjiS (DUF1127 family)
MTSIMTHLRTAAVKRAAYNRTVDEISRMPLDVALDLGIFREDAHQIARKADYGRSGADRKCRHFQTDLPASPGRACRRWRRALGLRPCAGA